MKPSRSPALNVVRALPLLLIAVVLVGFGLAAWLRAGPPSPQPHSYGVADIGGPFHLINQNGRPEDQRLLNGKWSAVFFGYTFCPDTCPATLTNLAAAQKQLGPDAKHFQVVFITVDPARDTPAELKNYLSSQAFPQGTVGLTGTPDQIAQVAKAYHVYYAKQGSGADYSMDHSAAIYLMDPKGRFVKPLDESQPTAKLADQIRESMRQG